VGEIVPDVAQSRARPRLVSREPVAGSRTGEPVLAARAAACEPRPRPATDEPHRRDGKDQVRQFWRHGRPDIHALQSRRLTTYLGRANREVIASRSAEVRPVSALLTRNGWRSGTPPRRPARRCSPPLATLLTRHTCTIVTMHPINACACVTTNRTGVATVCWAGASLPLSRRVGTRARASLTT
jgi:hypothetical protein